MLNKYINVDHVSALCCVGIFAPVNIYPIIIGPGIRERKLSRIREKENSQKFVGRKTVQNLWGGKLSRIRGKNSEKNQIYSFPIVLAQIGIPIELALIEIPIDAKSIGKG